MIKFLFRIIVVGLCIGNNGCKPNMNGPKLEDLEDKMCPSYKPILCIPFGTCCSYSEFCHAGMCESCFYDRVLINLLEWCRELGQYNVSLMRSSSCKFACQDRFTPHELMSIKNLSETNVGVQIITELKAGQSSSGQSSQQDDSKSVAIIIISATLLSIAVVVIIYKCRNGIKHYLQEIFNKINRRSEPLVSNPADAENSSAPNRDNSISDNPLENLNQTRWENHERGGTEGSSSQSGTVTRTSSFSGKSVPDSTPPQKRCTANTSTENSRSSLGIEGAQEDAVDLSESRQRGQNEESASGLAQTVPESQEVSKIDAVVAECIKAPHAPIKDAGRYNKDVELNNKPVAKENMPECLPLLPKVDEAG